MKLKDVPNDTLIAKATGKKEPLHHKGKDGRVRVVVGTGGGWHSMCAMEMRSEKQAEFTPDTEVQPIFISYPAYCE